MVVAVLSAASSFGFSFQPKHERFRFPREIQNFLQGMTKTLGIWASFVYHNNSIEDMRYKFLKTYLWKLYHCFKWEYVSLLC